MKRRQITLRSFRAALAVALGLGLAGCSYFDKEPENLSPEERAERAAERERERLYDLENAHVTETSLENDELVHEKLDAITSGTYPGDDTAGISSLFYDDPRGAGGIGGGGGGGVGVNSYLWRASLDTVSFMPVATADPFGGVIITDWHTPPDAPGERFKLNVYILGRGLRADGVRVGAFRQILDRNGAWRNAAVPAKTNAQIEDAILTKARKLRSKALQKK